MSGKVHVIGGLLIAIASITLAKKYQITIAFDSKDLLIGTFLGSLLPDIDHKKSFLGSLLHLPIKHRTLTHSLLFLLLVSIIAMQYNLGLSIGLFLGIFSHILLDMAGKKSKGVCLFYPSKKRYSFFNLP